MLCTSGFVDDVTFTHDGPMAPDARPAAIEHDKHNSRDSSQILPINKGQRVLILSGALGAKSAIYDCLVAVVVVVGAWVALRACVLLRATRRIRSCFQFQLSL